MRGFNEFIKTAKTRVQKMVDAGLIKDKKLLDKIYDVKPEIKDSIHNRINAKAKAAAAAAKDKVENDSFVLRRKIRDAKGAISDLASRKEMAQRKLKPYIEEKKLYSKAFQGEKRKSILSTLDSAMQPHQARYKDLDARLKKKTKVLRSDRRTLNNAMSEAGKRSSLSDVTKKPMTAERYKKLSGISGLKSRPAIDTNRTLKGGGESNAKVIREARSRLGKGNVTVTHDKDISPLNRGKLDTDQALMMDVENGRTRSFRYEDDKNLAAVEIGLPNKKSTTINSISKGVRQLPPRHAREERGKAAFHEISGELRELMDREDVMNRHGITKNQGALNLGKMGSHQNPFVLKRDADFQKGLSPASARRTNRTRKWLGENEEMNRLILGNGVTEEQLKKPFSENIKGNWNPEKVLTERAKRQGYDTDNPLLQNMIKSMSYGK